MTDPFGRLAASYFTDLFDVGVGGGVYAFLPFLITAIAIGVVLAAVVFTVLRAREAAFLRRLAEAGADSAKAGKTLTELGYAPGSFRTRLLLRILKNPTCFLYRNASSDALDRVKAAFAAMQAAGEDGATEAAPDKDAGADHAANRAIADSAATNAAEETAVADSAAASGDGGTDAPEGAENASAPRAGQGTDAEARRAAREEARRRRQLGMRVTATDATRFYIPAERRAYVDSRACSFSADDIMGLVYTTAAAALFWFILLNVLEPLLKLLTK